MKFSDITRKILGVLTVWLVVYIAMLLLYIFAEIFAELFNLTPIDKFMNGIPGKIFPFVHFLSILNILGLMVFYIVYVFKTPRVPKDKKDLWAVVILCGHIFAIPVFWYFYVRRILESKNQET